MADVSRPAPVDDISVTASRISGGNLSERVDVADTDSELGRLAGVLNSTFARLDAAFAQQNQFTADASHELRTPLAVIISEAQTTLARERTAAEYRETVEACLDTAQQMRQLTDSLLQLARFDAGQEPIRRGAVDLAETARRCVGRIGPLAKERGINIHSDLRPAETCGDADRLSQLITNLLTNAIHYNQPKGEILVSTRSENGGTVLTVTDTGQGIAAEDVPHSLNVFIGPISRARAPKAVAASASPSAKPSSIIMAAPSKRRASSAQAPPSQCDYRLCMRADQPPQVSLCQRRVPNLKRRRRAILPKNFSLFKTWDS